MKKIFLSFAVVALAFATFGAEDRSALARLLNARAGTSPKVCASAAEKVRAEADAGGALQQYAIAILAADAGAPQAAKIGEKQRKAWLESSRVRVREMAEKENNPMAWFLLSLGENDMQALERAAAGGSVQALNAWGNALVEQALQSVSTNVADKTETMAKGFGCFKQAAAKKDANAFYNLGMCYMSGYGCEGDAGRAFQCFRAAAEAGHPEAINNIGGFYRDGIVVPTNAVLSVRWFKKSADLGNAYGQLNYALAMQRGDGEKRDEAAAAKLIKEACDQGCAEAMDAYGMCFHSGIGVERDVGEALRWFQKSAEAGFPPAMDNLAECYDRGEGTERDILKAAEWKMRARAARGDPNARAWVAGDDAKKKEQAK